MLCPFQSCKSGPAGQRHRQRQLWQNHRDSFSDGRIGLFATIAVCLESPFLELPLMISQRLKRALPRTLALLVLSLSWLVVFWPQSRTRGQNSPPPKTMLVLYWYGHDFVSNIRLDKDIREVLKSEPPGSVEYYPEYLESNRFPGERQSLLFRDYLAQKYAGRKIDVVLAFSPPALNFVLKYCNELFGDTPIVFSTLQLPVVDSQTHPAGMTGVVADRMFARTLDLALKLHPNTTRVYVVIGTSEHDNEFNAGVREELKPLESRVAMIYLSDLPLDELLSTVKNVPDHSLVFYVRYSLDDPGKSIDPFDALALIAQSARVPVYSLGAEPLMGRGTVGGYHSDDNLAGRTFARMALQVAKGTRAQDIPIYQIPNVIRFDANQLKRWNIDERSLPSGSVVLFKESSFWERYKWRIIGVMGLVAFQAMLIAVLLFERKRRQRANESLNERLRFETLLSKLSAEFTDVPASKVEPTIVKWIKELEAFLMVDNIELVDVSCNGDGVSHKLPLLQSAAGATAVPLSDAALDQLRRG